VPNTVAAGQTVFTSTSDCAGCHGADLAGVGQFPNLQNIGNQPVTNLPFPISQLDKLKADYAKDSRAFLEAWIRDSATNYNGGQATQMPPHPQTSLSDSALQALITFLLAQKK
jgi:mono/diheme cytochrome c family protein